VVFPSLWCPAVLCWPLGSQHSRVGREGVARECSSRFIHALCAAGMSSMHSGRLCEQFWGVVVPRVPRGLGRTAAGAVDRQFGRFGCVILLRAACCMSTSSQKSILQVSNCPTAHAANSSCSSSTFVKTTHTRPCTCSGHALFVSSLGAVGSLCSGVHAATLLHLLARLLEATRCHGCTHRIVCSFNT
jgi:hypothetical protein